MDNKYKNYIVKSRYYKIFGAGFIVSGIIYLVWLAQHLNTYAKLVSYSFFFAQFYTFILVSLSIYNHWSAKYRLRRPKFPSKIPEVAVVVPVYNEPVDVIKRTLKSIIHLSYPGRLVVVVSAGFDEGNVNVEYQDALRSMMSEMQYYIKKNIHQNIFGKEKKIHLFFSNQKGGAKAGNLNGVIGFLEESYPKVDLVLTQDADEIVHNDILTAIVGYFSDSKVAYVQTIKQSIVIKDDPFGNRDLMWYCRTAPSRDKDSAMISCGSGVMWRISAVKSVGGFSTWNLVEDLTTSYNLLCAGWKSKYHFEALSKGLAPEDLPNFIKQRGTWALDNLRLFFWDNPLTKRKLSLKQKLHFLETALFYLNSFAILTIVLNVSYSLIFKVWPTTSDAITHASFLLPSFIAMEAYFVSLAGNIPFKRVRQFWIGLAPVFIVASMKALFYGPHKKPKYKVTRKENIFGNYTYLVWSQLTLLGIIFTSLAIVIVNTPLYSGFDWAALFWGFYMASYFLQIIKVSIWNWNPTLIFEFSFIKGFRKLLAEGNISAKNLWTKAKYVVLPAVVVIYPFIKLFSSSKSISDIFLKLESVFSN